MIRALTNQAAQPVARKICVVCDVEMRRDATTDRCGWHPSEHRTCPCGELLRRNSVSGLCRPCMILRHKLPVRCHDEFARRVRSGELTPREAVATILAAQRAIARLPQLGAPAPVVLRTAAPGGKVTVRHTTVGIPAMVINAVAEHLDLSAADLTGPSRAQGLVHARAVIAMVLIGRGYSRPHVGRVVGGRDHASVCNWERKYSQYCAIDPRLPGIVTDVAARVASKTRPSTLDHADEMGGIDEPV